MPCPLTDYQIVDVLNGLGEEFRTVGFVRECPRSGGTSAARDCPHADHGSNRSHCGTRLSEYTERYPRHLKYVGPGNELHPAMRIST